jgi:hypothetical protein
VKQGELSVGVLKNIYNSIIIELTSVSYWSFTVGIP